MADTVVNGRTKPGKHVFRKFRHDEQYRHRVLYTTTIFISFAIMGGIKSQLGPAFLDLMVISGVDLEAGSWIISSLYIGYTTGAMLNGFLFHICNPMVLFAICSFGMAVTIAAIPWCVPYGLMVSAHILTGIFEGLADAGGNAAVIQMWKKRNSSMVVALHLIFNFGGIISPLIISPFLLPSPEPSDANYLSNESIPYNDSRSQVTMSSLSVISANANLTNNIEEIKTGDGNPKSQIYIAYSISSAVCILTGTAYIALFVSSKKQEKDKEEITSLPQRKPSLPQTLRVLSLCVMVSIATLSNAIDHALSSYLTTFCVEELGWSKAEGSLLTSIVFIAVVVGGGCGIFLTNLLNTIIYEGIQCTLLLLSLVMFLVSVKLPFQEGVWIFCFLFGFAKSVIFPLVLTWTNVFLVPISGRIAAVFFVGAMSGSAVNPILLGVLMNNFSNLWFCYLFILETILITCLYSVAVVITRYIKKNYRFAGEETCVDTAIEIRNITECSDSTKLPEIKEGNKLLEEDTRNIDSDRSGNCVH